MVKSLPANAKLTTTGDDSPQAAVNEVYTDGKEQKQYRYVKNTDSVALDPGLFCYWDGVTGRDTGRVVKTVANKKGPAGMPMAAIGAGKYGYIQTKGPNANAEVITTAAGPGEGLMGSGTDGKFIKSDGTKPCIAVNDGASTSTGTGKTVTLRFP